MYQLRSVDSSRHVLAEGARAASGAPTAALSRLECEDASATHRAPDQAPGQPGLVRWYHCTNCSAPITPEDAAIAVAGGHEHIFTNPHGATFRIGCFAAAPGTVAVTDETQEHTWFAGYAWAIVVCKSCSMHLGWRFRGDTGVFHGLILTRITLFGPNGV